MVAIGREAGRKSDVLFNKFLTSRLSSPLSKPGRSHLRGGRLDSSLRRCVAPAAVGIAAGSTHVHAMLFWDNVAPPVLMIGH